MAIDFIRKTDKRIFIMDTVFQRMEEGDFPTLKEIAEKAEKKKFGMTRGTLKRQLDRLIEIGMLRKKRINFKIKYVPTPEAYSQFKPRKFIF